MLDSVMSNSVLCCPRSVLVDELKCSHCVLDIPSDNSACQSHDVGRFHNISHFDMVLTLVPLMRIASQFELVLININSSPS